MPWERLSPTGKGFEYTMGDKNSNDETVNGKKRFGAYSNASAKVSGGKKASSQHRFPLDYAKRYYDADPSYWGQPLAVRAYLRVLYAAMGFVCTVYFFDSVAHVPLWMQLVLGCSVALGVLMFRMAYPGGGTNVWEWIMEGMAEAAKEQEAKGKKPKVTAEEIQEALASGGRGTRNKKQPAEKTQEQSGKGASK